MKQYQKMPQGELALRLDVMEQLANATSMQILRYLSWAKMGFNITISKAVDVSPQLVSKRLKLLINVGLVTKEKIVKNRVYRLNQEQFSRLGLSVDLFFN